ncbi:hypothetical protein A3A76_02585 [Candidatus Woesebacteria bacterium RIFCSPLOWO2_01_FULL_39_23]|uniref:Type II secretion system protein GspI C-terminal domain-containing protein n=1 Tax=Candidatus Woesebacteria bacterium RIFCSPHIGHO2_01_FULL_40_22 TaxID=1802499 RepID=A0A1F7YJA0_9BACT|nr:MAG: hypothetical protein A2141_01445 [Candidatus Woesebacteria bacterium RBG_16_40_11]OGM27363.1 MAG: hypothetical protein A2628_00990 [Candidatus Woesebacteria bacterium RIFCSPHIGHO2_01_FULL_40_22]OGM62535.1 MAG: hypothetical protein A3A76_02585 [Candidatus Woesebacteria bacterium RIFCSPLOWO2_01_FULL_39_23]
MKTNNLKLITNNFNLGLPRTNAPRYPIGVSSVRGQSMVEVVFAIGIAAIILTTVVSVSVSSVRNSTFSKLNSQANRYAQDLSEWLRRQRDLDWATFKAKANTTGITYCFKTPNPTAWPASGVCGSSDFMTGTKFIRQAKLSLPSTDPLVLSEVTVSWTDSQGTHSVVSITKLVDWRAQP